MRWKNSFLALIVVDPQYSEDLICLMRNRTSAKGVKLRGAGTTAVKLFLLLFTPLVIELYFGWQPAYASWKVR